MLEPKRILIVRPSALGDVCRTVPVLATLRRAFPQASIDWLVQEEYAAAIRAHPALDAVVTFPRGRFSSWWRSPAVAREMLGWFAALGRRGYELAIDCQGLGRSGLIAWATRARRRVGPRGARELGWLGYTVRHPVPAGGHAVDQMMALLAAEGLEPVYDLRLYLAAENQAWGQDWVKANVRGRYAVFAPTSRWPGKRWPESSWCRLIGPVLERGLQHVVLVGAAAERDQVGRIVAAGPSELIDLVGRTSLGQTMAVIASSALVVANDSAPLHMAVGFDRPAVGLYGPTDPRRVGPYRRADAVVCKAPAAGRLSSYKDRRAGAALMALIEPADVLERVDRVLGACGRLARVEPEVPTYSASGRVAS